jgi:hypothetical protein
MMSLEGVPSAWKLRLIVNDFVISIAIAFVGVRQDWNTWMESFLEQFMALCCEQFEDVETNYKIDHSESIAFSPSGLKSFHLLVSLVFVSFLVASLMRTSE